MSPLIVRTVTLVAAVARRLANGPLREQLEATKANLKLEEAPIVGYGR